MEIVQEQVFFNLVSIWIATLGFATVLLRRSFFGCMLGLHVTFMGISLLFSAQAKVDLEQNQSNGYAVGFLVQMMSLLVFCLGAWLMVRFFYQKKSIDLDQIQSQKG